MKAGHEKARKPQNLFQLFCFLCLFDPHVAPETVCHSGKIAKHLSELKT